MKLCKESRLFYSHFEFIIHVQVFKQRLNGLNQHYSPFSKITKINSKLPSDGKQENQAIDTGSVVNKQFDLYRHSVHTFPLPLLHSRYSCRVVKLNITHSDNVLVV